METTRGESLFKPEDAVSGTKWLFLTVTLQFALLARTILEISRDAFVISNAYINISVFLW